MEKINDLNDLLKHEIEDLYSVEEQIIEALPKMIAKAGDKTLKNALTEHLRFTNEQKNRLDKIQKIMNKGVPKEPAQKKGFLSGIFGGSKHTCKGMQGIIEEGNKMMAEKMSPQVLDAAIIACTQKVEHYEICGYGTARTYAAELKLEEVAKLLEQTLNEEYAADDLLTQLAVKRINLQAGTPARNGERRVSATNSRVMGRESEKVRREEPEMETASAKRSSSKSAGPQDESPKGDGGRSEGGRRPATSAKKSAGADRNAKTGTTKASEKNNSKSSGSKRASGSSGRSR